MAQSSGQPPFPDEQNEFDRLLNAAAARQGTPALDSDMQRTIRIAIPPRDAPAPQRANATTETQLIRTMSPGQEERIPLGPPVQPSSPQDRLGETMLRPIAIPMAPPKPVPVPQPQVAPLPANREAGARRALPKFASRALRPKPSAPAAPDTSSALPPRSSASASASHQQTTLAVLLILAVLLLVALSALLYWSTRSVSPA